MIKMSLTKLAGVAGLGLLLTAGTGIASAAPNLDSMVNTTCSYQQVTAALNAQGPGPASDLSGSADAMSMLQQFLGMPPGQRRQMANLLAGHPANQPYLGPIEQAFNTCNQF
ncbi:hypothetical protein MCHIJ_19970 [Mycolicibacterium chitae]|uniref:Low molecular weight t-cell antigen tb8.4 n=1 Tax=Mycolicibacterium chitae TaxID=1792 RepID=A0A3S5EHY8_MYCCI|nr:hemophore-related protein [Mycolicibacterium chitae]MCV7107174.1 hemophore-related protein [Mycolicibacterium chitae]BBZ02560.1 hypothetical protein MCHIJ_19970 [Mycolicibacterium chitae]VEG45238.1 low molecular weight t-cell antigen tb8.4 [Mycolicibacterium chitae]